MRTSFAAFLLVLIATTHTHAKDVWSVTVCGPDNDVRHQAVMEAVTFWNEQLRAIGAKLTLGPVERSDRTVPNSTLTALSEGALSRGRAGNFPRELSSVRGDLLIVFSSADLVSVGMGKAGGREGGLVIVRRGDVPPLSLPNVARNLLAHEIGHILGLSHTSNDADLMCGRPAACRPGVFQSSTPRFFPLTDAEKRQLVKAYK